MATLGLNAVALEPGRTGGAERYVRALIRHLPAHLTPDEKLVVLLPVGHDCHVPEGVDVVTCRVTPHARIRRVLWEQWHIPRLARKLGLDAMLLPYGTAIARMPCPTVLTIHDTLRHQIPGSLTGPERPYRAIMDWLIARRRDQLIVPSAHEASVLTGKLGIEADRIHIVHHGVDQPGELEAGEHGAVERLDEVLWVGRPYAHKNLALLIDAFGQLRARLPSRPLTLRLVGIDAEAQPQLAAMAAAAGLADSVTLEASIDSDALAHRYRTAALLAYPSRCESFCLPIAEALAHGLPVVCSDLPVFRELYGNAVLRVSADDAGLPGASGASGASGGLCEAMMRVLTEPSLRESQVAAGYRVVESYTWTSCAAATLGVLRRAKA